MLYHSSHRFSMPNSSYDIIFEGGSSVYLISFKNHYVATFYSKPLPNEPRPCRKMFSNKKCIGSLYTGETHISPELYNEIRKIIVGYNQLFI